MKRIKAFGLVLAVLLAAATADANYYPRRHGHHSGLHGTITSVGTRGFILSVDVKRSAISSTGITTLKILCDVNTRFLRGRAAADPSQISEGITVSVVGASLASDTIQAATVTIEGSRRHRHKSQ